MLIFPNQHFYISIFFKINQGGNAITISISAIFAKISETISMTKFGVVIGNVLVYHFL